MSDGVVVGSSRLSGAAARMHAAATSRHLAALGRDHLGDGLPQMAVFAFEHVGNTIAVWGRYERDELALLMRCLQGRLAPGGACLDVGANIGNHALFFAEHCAEVIAFEPNPRSFALLRFNAALRPNIRCLNLGASDADTRARLAVPDDNIGMASLHADATGAGVAGVDCELRRLDGLPELAGQRVALVKIDVEGHEAAVLRGAQALLQRERPVVVLEQAASEIRAGTSASIEFLRGIGYRRFWSVERAPATGSRLVNLLLRLLRGETLRMVERERFEARFHSMIVALPDSAG